MHEKVPQESEPQALAAVRFPDAPQPRSRRLALWEIGGGVQCSIIGTCLSDANLAVALRKNRLQVNADAESYDLHSYCVRAASQSSPFAHACKAA